VYKHNPYKVHPEFSREFNLNPWAAVSESVVSTGYFGGKSYKYLKPEDRYEVHITAECIGGAYEFSLAEITRIVKIFSDDFLVPVESIKIHPDYSNGYYDSIDRELNIVGSRWETDEEYEERQEKHRVASERAKESTKKAAITKKQKELEEYERLKKKFEKC
jgi:hypothetical protein